MIMQRNWIGRSEGAEVDFPLETGDDLTVFTTRPDTLFGATYMVLAPEHPLVAKLTTRRAARRGGGLRRGRAAKSDLERTRAAEGKDRRVHRRLRGQSGQRGEDPDLDRRLRAGRLRHRRDHGRAGATTSATTSSPRSSACPSARWSRRRQGRARRTLQPRLRRRRHRGEFRPVRRPGRAGRPRRDIAGWRGRGEAGAPCDYKLRDWIFSPPALLGRAHPDRLLRAVRHRAGAGDELPVLLPEVEDYKPTGTGEIAAGPRHRLGEHDLPELRRTGAARDRHHGHLRGLVLVLPPLPLAPRRPRPPATATPRGYWLPVDLYVGGAEHAVMHLLYARFCTKVLFDAGFVDFGEPYAKLRNQGIILAEDGEKMCKSQGQRRHPRQRDRALRRRHPAAL